VIDTEPSVVLANSDGVAVRGATTLLAALRALGLDNVLVEVEGREIPSSVASFWSFVEVLADAGVQTQDVPRRALRIEQTVEIRDSFGFAALSPAPEFCLRLGVAGTDAGGDGVLVSGALASDLMEPANGLSPWDDGHLDQHLLAARSSGNAPLWELGVLPPLLRPRMIDAIGHLALAGAPLIGHMRGYRSGPGLHQALLRAVMLRRAAARVTVDEHRQHLLADPDDPDEHPLLAIAAASRYFH
jgi:UDP-3-O-[3-hydroxymyristoyl] N-acetylglucosamine deacetylase